MRGLKTFPGSVGPVAENESLETRAIQQAGHRHLVEGCLRTKGFCPFLLHFLSKSALQENFGNTPGSPIPDVLLPDVGGPKSSVCPLKRRENKLFGGISRDFGGISRGRPKSSKI